jgi:hypothetical protein
MNTNVQMIWASLNRRFIQKIKLLLKNIKDYGYDKKLFQNRLEKLNK